MRFPVPSPFYPCNPGKGQKGSSEEPTTSFPTITESRSVSPKFSIPKGACAQPQARGRPWMGHPPPGGSWRVSLELSHSVGESPQLHFRKLTKIF